MKIDGKNIFIKDDFLASFAQKNKNSRGRKYTEPVDPDRLPFQRDRDRIIHSKSFRRLKGKTQVVSPDFGDHFRNRLTHTLEVTQIARDIARQLFLNEDLTEAIALAHDLGHPPFGHAGEEALDEKMKSFGFSFEHNEQSLRVVEFFENRYKKFPGLNLNIETLEGLQKHNTFFDRPNNEIIFSPHLESQIVDIADEIAYLSADLEDGLSGKFFDIKDLESIQIPTLAINTLEKDDKTNISAIVRRNIKILLEQIIKDTKKNLQKYKIKKLSDVQKCPQKIIFFNEDFFEKFKELKNFLFQNYYLSPKIKKFTNQGKEIIYNLFDHFYKQPKKLPKKFLDEPLEKRICDHIAGMTDEFAKKI